MPDCFWSHAPTLLNGWLETKVSYGWTVDLRPHQIAWLTLNAQAGVRCVIAVRQLGMSNGVPTDRDNLFLLDGREAAYWGREGLPRPDTPEPPSGVLGRWEGGPRRWPWEDVARTLLA